jgi:deoxyinosine 3'endonuclease (endonuclease V)
MRILFYQYGLSKSIKRKRRRIPLYFRKQRDIVSSIVIDTDQIEQPIKYLVGLDISFVESNDKAVASMVIVDNENLNVMAKISVNCNIIH